MARSTRAGTHTLQRSGAPTDLEAASLRFLFMQESLAPSAIVVARQLTYAVGRESAHLTGVPSRDRTLTNELWSAKAQARQPKGDNRREKAAA